MAEFSTLTPVQKARANARTQRISQRDVEPTAIKPRLTGDIISRVSSISRGVATVPDGMAVTITATLQNINSKRLFAGIDRATYVGSVAVDNELPSGSSITESDYQVIGPYRSLLRTDGLNEKSVLWVGNNSGGEVTIISDIRSRYLINEGGVAS